MRKICPLILALIMTGCSLARVEPASVNWDNMAFGELQCDPGEDPTCDSGKVTADRILGSRSN